jgi:hypothetical protein
MAWESALQPATTLPCTMLVVSAQTNTWTEKKNEVTTSHPYMNVQP